MAISAANFSYITQGPAANNQVLQASALSLVELAYFGTVQIIGDGANTSVSFNYIDGNNQLPFKPTGFLTQRCSNNNSGGNAAAANTVLIENIFDNNNNNLGATAVLAAAPANNAGATFAVFILK